MTTLTTIVPANGLCEIFSAYRLDGTRTTVQDTSFPVSNKSPLRYPGGKSRGVGRIRRFIPDDVGALCAPFLGGGSVELACAADGITVYGSDAFEPVINFWKQAKINPASLAERVQVRHPLTRSKFYSLQKAYHNLSDPLEKAAIFYVLNRSSFSGTTLSGGMSPGHSRFTLSSIDRLRSFHAPNLVADCADYRDAISAHQDMFLYLDPPYANGGKLYGNRGDMHSDFDHEELADVLKKREGWVLSYNDSPEILKLYQGYRIERPEWSYGMSNDKQSKEVLIVAL